MSLPFPPALLLSLLLIIGYAGLFHLWGGQTLRDLLLYLLAAMAGFTAGHWSGEILDVPLPKIGELHVFAASLGAWIGLVIIYLFQHKTDTAEN